MVELDKLTKLYYSIGEVADMFDVSTSLIRYWETEFNSLRPHKNSKGDRRFTQKNIEQLQLIYYLVKEKGFTLDGAKNEIKALKKREKKFDELTNRLIDIREGLRTLRQAIEEEE